MTDEQVKKLAELAARSRAAGVRLQELDDSLLVLIPAEAREQVRLAMRLRAEFSLYLHTVFDVVEWCKRRQSETADKPDKIIEDAAAQFTPAKKTRREFVESIHSAWIRKDWDLFNRLKKLRKSTG